MLQSTKHLFSLIRETPKNTGKKIRETPKYLRL